MRKFCQDDRGRLALHDPSLDDTTAAKCRTDRGSLAVGLTGKCAGKNRGSVTLSNICAAAAAAVGVFVSGSRNSPLVLLCYGSLVPNMPMFRHPARSLTT